MRPIPHQIALCLYPQEWKTHLNAPARANVLTSMGPVRSTIPLGTIFISAKFMPYGQDCRLIARQALALKRQ
jgi:hypothetical protein